MQCSADGGWPRVAAPSPFPGAGAGLPALRVSALAVCRPASRVLGAPARLGGGGLALHPPRPGALRNGVVSRLALVPHVLPAREASACFPLRLFTLSFVALLSFLLCLVLHLEATARFL